MGIKSMKLMADFETTTDPNDVRVWAACAVDIETQKIAHLGNNIDDFFAFLQGKNTKVWFHNLRFDGEWILYYLLTHGYKWVKGVDNDGNKVPLKNKEFTSLITDEGLFYSIEVMFKRHEKTRKLEKVTFFDSLKKLPFPVRRIAKAFNLEMAKGSINYTQERPEGWKLTEEEKEYIMTDCKIVAEALKIQFKQGLDRMTNASDAMASFKNGIGGDDMFRKWFPELPLALDEEIRLSYRGGYVYLKPEYRNVRGMLGITFDVNSLYPSIMYDRLLPYGYPVFFEGQPVFDERYPLYIMHFKCCFELKKGHLPTLQVKGTRRFVETEYLTTSRTKIGRTEENRPVELYLTNVDYALFLDHYDIIGEPEYINGWKFKGASGMFKDYIDYWMHIKETSTDALRQLAKLQLNSLYGRFAQNPKTKRKIPYLDIETGCVRYSVPKEYEYRESVYTPMACFITAYSREKTIRSAQAVYDRFIYADTDSLHLIGHEEPNNLDIHPTNLGAWKNEGAFVDSKFLRAKTYIEATEHNEEDTLKNYAQALTNPHAYDLQRTGEGVYYRLRKVTCAGMPDNVKEYVDFDNFAPGESFPGKLMPRRYPGGVVLEEVTFTISK